MIRTWSRLALAAALAAGAPLVANAQDDIKAVLKKLDGMSKQLDKLEEFRARLEIVESARANQATQLDSLAKRVTASEGEISKLHASVDQIQNRLQIIEKSMGSQIAASTALYPPSITPSGITPPASTQSLAPPTNGCFGRIRLQNNYCAGLELIVNNCSRYRVAAHQTLDIGNVPAGSLTYQVIVDGFGPTVYTATTVEANKTVLLVVQ
jgi:uncharacterized coiled-coil protein SlyX